MQVTNEELRKLSGEEFWAKYGQETLAEVRAKTNGGGERTTGILERLATAPSSTQED